MRYSFRWLAELSSLPADVTPSQLGERVTRQVAEVDGVSAADAGLDCVVAGRITEVAAHPQADRLGVATVDVGAAAELTIVFGNVLPLAVGDVVPVAVGPCTLPTGITVRAGDIRGVRSAGMVCVDEELGLDLGGMPLADPKHPGATIHLKKLEGVAPGTPLGEALGRNDSTLEVSSVAITNRPDLWGHVGLAREIAALWGTTLTPPKSAVPAAGKGEPVAVDLQTKLCRRYVAALVEKVVVGPSPEWLASRLLACGVRSINNVVDATNYVMLELGQPLHAFDAAKVAGRRIVVREARKNESLATLDGQTRQLPEGAVLICDSEQPSALAGVMGGQGSQVTAETTSLLIESANFDPAAIRRAVSATGLRTDASARFEKDLDPTLAMQAMQRVLAILKMKDVCPGSALAAPLTDVGDYREHPAITVQCSVPYLAERLGVPIAATEVVEALKPLGFTLKRGAKDSLAIGVPSWRSGNDVSLPQDIVEEVGRRLGYDRIQPQLPSRPMAAPATKYLVRLGRQIKVALACQLGFSEANTYSFALPSPLAVPGGLAVANPPTASLSTMRQSLVPNLVAIVGQNVRQQPKLALFEYGRVFRSGAGSYDVAPGSSHALPPQPRSLGLVLTDPALDRTAAFRCLKGAVEQLLRTHGYEPEWDVVQKPLAFAPWLNLAEAAELTVGGESIGYVALAPAELVAQVKVRHPLAVAELDISRLSKLASSPVVAQPIPKFPGMVEDLSIVVPAEVRWADVRSLVEGFHPLISGVELFDVYEGKKVGDSLRSLAFHITFGSSERTLTADEVQQVVVDLGAAIKAKFKATIR